MPEAQQETPVRNAAVMRALAHPARLALLQQLGQRESATATECAEVAGLSPSATSYHLRALARAGLVEEAPGRGDGRERRWRRIGGRLQVEGAADSDDPEKREAMRALTQSVLDWDRDRARQYLTRLDDEPADWQDAAFFMDFPLVLTVGELRGLAIALQELLAPYRADAREAPAGARAVSATLRALPM